MANMYHLFHDFDRRIFEVENALDDDEAGIVRCVDEFERSFAELTIRLCPGKIKEYIVPFQNKLGYAKAINEVLSLRKYTKLRQEIDALHINYHAAALRLLDDVNDVELNSLYDIIVLLRTDRGRTEVDVARAAVMIFTLDIIYFIHKHIDDIFRTITKMYPHALGDDKNIIRQNAFSHLLSIQEHYKVLLNVLFG